MSKNFLKMLTAASILALAGMKQVEALTASEITTATGIEGGLCLYPGCDDGAIAAGLASNGRLVVHCLVTDNQTLAQVRPAIESAGVYGIASAEAVSSFSRLPYMRNLANIIVADLDALSSKGLTEQEVMRVLAPFGAAYLRKGGTWSTIKKPLPATMGEFKHGWNYNAENNSSSKDSEVGIPNAVKWISWYRNESSDMGSTKYAMTMTNGKMLMPTRYRNYMRRIPGNDKASHMQARDAFSGVLLWQKRTWDNKTEQNLLAACAENGVFFTTDSTGGNGVPLAIDAATGNTIRKFSAGISGKYSYVHYYENKLIQVAGTQVSVLDPNTGSEIWRYSYGPTTGGLFLPTCGDGKLFIAYSSSETGPNGEGHTQYLRHIRIVNVTKIICLDLNSKTKLWETNAPCPKLSYMIYAQNGLHLYTMARDQNDASLTNTVARINATNGALTWAKRAPQSNEQPAGTPIWEQIQSMIVENNQVKLLGFNSIKIYDMMTGADGPHYCEIVQKGSGTCSYPRAAANVMHMNMGTYVTKDNKYSLISLGRGACATGQWPAYGSWYNGPARCGCLMILRGLSCFTTEPKLPLLTPSSVRIQQGSAIAVPLSKNASLTDSTKGPITYDWTWNDIYPRMVSPSVTSGAITIESQIHNQRLVARSGGNVVWTFIAGGRIANAPLIENGKVFFGANDGYVYCLNLSDGSPVWRFLAAPYDQRMVAYDQVESRWPVYGVTMHNGKLYFSAGRHQDAGNIYIWGVNPGTGAVMDSLTIVGKPYTDTIIEGKKNFAGWTAFALVAAKMVNGVLTSNGSSLVMQFSLPVEYNSATVGGTMDVPQSVDIYTLNPVPTATLRSFDKLTGRNRLTSNAFRALSGGIYRVEMYDAEGRLVAKLFEKYVAPGEHNFRIPKKLLAHGSYVLILRTSRGVSGKRQLLVM